MAKQSAESGERLFEESSNGQVSAITTVFFLLSSILLFGGLVVMSYAFGAGEWGTLLFSAGLASCMLGVIVPTTLLPALGK